MLDICRKILFTDGLKIGRKNGSGFNDVFWYQKIVFLLCNKWDPELQGPPFQPTNPFFGGIFVGEANSNKN